MASRGLGTLTLDLAIKTGAFERGMTSAERTLDKRVRSMQRRAEQVGKAIGVALVAAAGIATAAFKQTIDSMDEISKSAQKVGITTEALSQLAHAAELSDVSIEQLQTGLARMTKFQAEAAQGGKKAVQTFKAFGIEIRDVNGHLRGTTDVLEDFARVFAALPDGPEKTALALRVFGKSGAEMIPLLNEGADGLREMREEADRLGLTISGETGKQAEEFNDNLTRLQANLKGVANEIVSPVLPELVKLSNTLKDLNAEGSGFGELIAAGIGRIGKAIRSARVEIEFFQKASTSELLFGGGLLGLAGRAREEFERREALSDSLAIHRGPLGRGSVTAARERGRLEREAAEAAKALLATESGGGGGRKQKDEVDELAQALARMNTQLDESIALYNQTGEAAKIRYQIEFGELQKATQAEKDQLLLKAQRLDMLAVEKQAREEAIRLEEEERKAAEEHAKEIRELLDDLAFETSLTKLSNDEKERAIILRRSLAGATQAEAEQITAAVDEMLAAQRSSGEMASAMDEFRASFEDTVVDVVTGAKSIGDAFKSLADTLVAQIARIIAQQLTTSLFGAPGSTSGGSQGWLSSLFSIFLPKHAAGTDFAPGGPSLVGEHGPEIVDLPRGSQVIPNHKLGGASVTVNINGGNNPRETALQTAREVRRVLAFSSRS